MTVAYIRWPENQLEVSILVSCRFSLQQVLTALQGEEP